LRASRGASQPRRRHCAAHPALRRPRARELGRITSLLKERRFTAGETVIKEGSADAAFYVIESGEATVTIRGEPRAA